MQVGIIFGPLPYCRNVILFLNMVFGVPHLATYISLFSYEPGLGATGIDPGMTFYIIFI